jgi:hypothetical protein
VVFDWERTPVIALSVFGVIVAAALVRLFEGVWGLCIMLRKAAVFGDGGGKDIGPPSKGVRPVPGVKPVRGVSPVRNEFASNGWLTAFWSCGPANIAGDNGPALRELVRLAEEKFHV